MKHSLHAPPPGNSFAKLPQDFYSRVHPPLFESPAEQIHFNPAAAERLQHLARRSNPKYILRNYLAQIATDRATQTQDYTEIDRMFKLLQNPFAEQPGMECYAGPGKGHSGKLLFITTGGIT